MPLIKQSEGEKQARTLNALLNYNCSSNIIVVSSKTSYPTSLHKHVYRVRRKVRTSLGEWERHF